MVEFPIYIYMYICIYMYIEKNCLQQQRLLSLYVTCFGKMSRKSPKVELRYGPRKSESGQKIENDFFQYS